MSKAQTGKNHTLESRAKMSMAQTGKKHTLETLAKMSMAQTGTSCMDADREVRERGRQVKI